MVGRGPERVIWRFPHSKDPFWGVPIVRVRTFLGSILGCPNLGKLPYRDYIPQKMGKPHELETTGSRVDEVKDNYWVFRV